jgi:hypothetical protein
VILITMSTEMLLLSVLIVSVLVLIIAYYATKNQSEPEPNPQSVPATVLDLPVVSPIPPPVVKSRLATVNGKDFLCPVGYYYEGDATQQACVKEGETGYICPTGWGKVNGKPYCQYSPDTSGTDNATGNTTSTTTSGGQPPPPINDNASTTTTIILTRKLRKIYKETPSWREGVMWNDELSKKPTGWLSSEQVLDVYDVSEALKDKVNSYNVYTSNYKSSTDVFMTRKDSVIVKGMQGNIAPALIGYTPMVKFAVRIGTNAGCVAHIPGQDRQMVRIDPLRTDCSGNGWTHLLSLK